MSDALASYVVRHGATRILGEFTPPTGQSFTRGDRVLIKSDRGQEVGDVLCPSSPAIFEQLPDPTRGQIVRRLTPQDATKHADIQARAQRELESACAIVAAHHLQMEFIFAERLFSGDRII